MTYNQLIDGANQKGMCDGTQQEEPQEPDLRLADERGVELEQDTIADEAMSLFGLSTDAAITRCGVNLNKKDS